MIRTGGERNEKRILSVSCMEGRVLSGSDGLRHCTSQVVRTCFNITKGALVNSSQNLSVSYFTIAI